MSQFTLGQHDEAIRKLQDDLSRVDRNVIEIREIVIRREERDAERERASSRRMVYISSLAATIVSGFVAIGKYVWEHLK